MVETRSGPRRAGAPLRAALYGSEAIDASQIDPDTLGLGPAGAAPLGRVSLADLDGDGHRDLTARFKLRAAGLAPSDTAACLRAQLFSGERLDGCAPVPPRESGASRVYCRAVRRREEPPREHLGRAERRTLRPARTALACCSRAASRW